MHDLKRGAAGRRQLKVWLAGVGVLVLLTVGSFGGLTAGRSPIPGNRLEAARLNHELITEQGSHRSTQGQLQTARTAAQKAHYRALAGPGAMPVAAGRGQTAPGHPTKDQNQVNAELSRQADQVSAADVYVASGPETANAAGARALQISGDCTWVLAS